MVRAHVVIFRSILFTHLRVRDGFPADHLTAFGQQLLDIGSDRRNL